MDGLIYDSPHLHELHKRFTQAAVDVKSIVNFYERYKTPLFKLWWFQWGAFVRTEFNFLYRILTLVIVRPETISYLFR